MYSRKICTLIESQSAPTPSTTNLPAVHGNVHLFLELVNSFLPRAGYVMATWIATGISMQANKCEYPQIPINFLPTTLVPISTGLVYIYWQDSNEGENIK